MDESKFPDGEELDQTVAREVFGLSQGQIDAWPWGVPHFSSDRNFAAGIISHLWCFDDTRRSLEREFAARLPKLRGGLAESLMVATPDEICKAAISAVRECGAPR